MQNLTFEVGKNYVDREGNQYTFVEKRGSVTIFEDTSGKRHCKNSIGRYRWDDKDDNRDITAAIDA